MLRILISKILYADLLEPSAHSIIAEGSESAHIPVWKGKKEKKKADFGCH